MIWLTLMFRENVGLLAMTKIGSRRVIQISATFMLFFSIFGILLFFFLLKLFHCTNEFGEYFFGLVLIYFDQNAGKFGAFFASIPLPIMASVYCIVLCFVCKSLHDITLTFSYSIYALSLSLKNKIISNAM